MGIEDIRALDSYRFNGLEWMKKNNITDVLHETFSVSFDVLGEVWMSETAELEMGMWRRGGLWRRWQGLW